MNEKIIITGGAGMVGSQVNFGQRLTRQDLDIQNPQSIDAAIKKYQPSVIFHLAGLVDMKMCEEFPERAYDINTFGTMNLAKACRRENIRLVYLSTCAIFDGQKNSPYIESDRPMPLNVYARTKWLGELIARDICSNSLIVRTGWLFGGGLVDKKFIRQFIQKLKDGNEVIAINDRYGSPTFVPDLLAKIKELIDNRETGLVHAVNRGCVSYFEVANKIKEIGNFKGKIKFACSIEIDSPNLKRAAMEALSSTRIKMRPWEEALKDYLRLI